MKSEAPSAISPEAIVQRIFELRGLRVMLDADLAVLYGVETKYVVRAIKRNPGRFPSDFVFQLSDDEWKNLRCQIGTSSSWGGRRSVPYALTEHGALMLSSVLSSTRAEEVSLLIVRAFVWLRQSLPAHAELAARLAELERTVGQHDEALGGIIEALHQLITPPDKEKRRIGF